MLYLMFFGVPFLSLAVIYKVFKDRLFFGVQAVYCLGILPGLFSNNYGLALMMIIFSVVLVVNLGRSLPPKPASMNIIERFKVVEFEVNRYPELIQTAIGGLMLCNLVLIGISLYTILSMIYG